MEILTALQWAKKGFIPNERGPKVQNNGLTAFTLPKLSISKTVRSMKIRTLPKPSFLPKGRSTGM